jgi:Icc-related predicted phosphoesterase
VGPVIVVNDIHASDKPPSSCTDSYLPDLLDLLRQTVVLAEQRRASAVVWAGDVFHHKGPHRTSHRLVQRLTDIGQSYPCPWFIVPGNHDIQHDRLESIEDSQPLGMLFRSGAVRLEGWAPGLPLYGVPWQQEWSERVIYGAMADFRDGMTDRSLVVTHAPVYPPGSEPRYAGAEYTPPQWWVRAGGDAGLGHGLVYGHIHDPHGIYTARDDSGHSLEFANPGALSRGSLDKESLVRPVQVTVWDQDTGFGFVPLDYRPAAEVFRLRRHGEIVTARSSLEEFRADLAGTELGALTVESVLAHVKTLGVSPDVEELAEELLQEAHHAQGN